MAHLKTLRRNMNLQEWARLEFARIDALLVTRRHPTGPWQIRIGDYHPHGYTWESDFEPISEGQFWGRPDGNAEMIGSAGIPESMAGQPVWLEVQTASEVFVYANGKLVDGVDPNRVRVKLTDAAKPGFHYDLRFEAYSRSKFDDERALETLHMRGCVQHFHVPELVTLNQEAQALKFDLAVLYEAAFGTLTPEAVKLHLQAEIKELLKLFPLYDSLLDELNAAVPRLRAYAREHVYRPGTSFGHTGKLACVAHSHLDLAYHWKVSQCVQKNARTCLVQLRLMDRYPEFRYAHSQAWCYEMLEAHYPELFEEIRKRVAEGRWDIVGGMYIEPDCNLPSAESFIRQVVYGKLYFLEKFGVEVDNCWVPDVFGNSAILPQILKLGGIDYFLSNKMAAFNDTNRFPHNLFLWRGVDGTEIYASVPSTHFITWNEPDQVLTSWQTFQDERISDETVHMYGFGDGGSGVNFEMLEYYERIKKLPGFPEMRLTTGRDYLHKSFAQHPERLEVWDGELYLEMHRGTFTTKGQFKRENRRAEFTAQEVESLLTLAALNGAPYPAGELKSAYKKLLVNQFHDILPGSHTNPVFHETVERYREMREEFSKLKQQALAVLAPPGAPDDICIFNPFSEAREGLAVLDGAGAGCLEDAKGNRYAVQRQELPGGGERYVARVPAVPPLGMRTLRKTGAPAAAGAAATSNGTLENRFFRLRFDPHRRLVEIYDKQRSRQIVPQGAVANEWQLFEDKPGAFNAWDILPGYEDHPIELADWDSIEVVENGPLSTAVRLRRAFSLSRAEQVIRLYSGAPRIDFETWVDWRETERLLKVAFPVEVLAKIYTTDTSAGVLERENNRNTTWQQARFEVCAHKWTDLSEGCFGVALMNDCKYGCDVKGNVIRLSLLKAPIRPDRVSDKGEHRFTYSLFPHDGDWRRSGLVEAAYDLNWPLQALGGRRGGPLEGKSGLSIDTPAVKCMAFKLDEKRQRDVVVRLVELYGSHATARLRPGFPFRRVEVCDLLERQTAEIASSRDCVEVSFRPYQIQTLKFVRGEDSAQE